MSGDVYMKMMRCYMWRWF